MFKLEFKVTCRVSDRYDRVTRIADYSSQLEKELRHAQGAGGGPAGTGGDSRTPELADPGMEGADEKAKMASTLIMKVPGAAPAAGFLIGGFYY